MLLIAGLGDPAEAWEFQLDGLSDRYTLTAFDNRGAGRVPLPDEPLTVETFADDAAALMRALDVPAAHVMGFSVGGAIAQHLALRHPELVRSLVLVRHLRGARPYLPRDAWTFGAGYRRSRPTSARSSKRSSCGSTRRARTRTGWSTRSSRTRLAFPHKQTTEAMQRSIDAFRRARHHGPARRDHGADARDRRRHGHDLPAATTGARSRTAIPGARFELMEGEAHQPFQEVPDQFNADGRRLLARGGRTRVRLRRRGGTVAKVPSRYTSEGCRSG